MWLEKNTSVEFKMYIRKKLVFIYYNCENTALMFLVKIQSDTSVPEVLILQSLKTLLCPLEITLQILSKRMQILILLKCHCF